MTFDLFLRWVGAPLADPAMREAAAAAGAATPLAAGRGQCATEGQP